MGTTTCRPRDPRPARGPRGPRVGNAAERPAASPSAVRLSVVRASLFSTEAAAHRSVMPPRRPPQRAGGLGPLPRPVAWRLTVRGRFTPVGTRRLCGGFAQAAPALTLGRLCRQEHSRSPCARCPAGPLRGGRPGPSPCPGQGLGSAQVSAAQRFCVRVQTV